MNLESFRRAVAEGMAMARTSGPDPVLATLTAILTRCDDLDAMCAADGRLDPVQVGIDSRRIREMAERARMMMVGRA